MIMTPIPPHVRIKLDRRPLRLPDDLQASVDRHWDVSTRANPHLARGELFAIGNMRRTRRELEITLHRTDYAHFLYARHAGLDDPYSCRMVVANGVVRTADGYYVIGEMNAFTSAPGRLQFVAGGIDRADIRGDVVDLPGSLAREAQEEIGIELTDAKLVSRVTPKLLVEWGSVALVYLIELAVDAESFRRRYERYAQSLAAEGATPEFSSVVFVHADEAAAFLRNDPRPKLDFLPGVLARLGEESA